MKILDIKELVGFTLRKMLTMYKEASKCMFVLTFLVYTRMLYAFQIEIIKHELYISLCFI